MTENILGEVPLSAFVQMLERRRCINGTTQTVARVWMNTVVGRNRQHLGTVKKTLVTTFSHGCVKHMDYQGMVAHSWQQKNAS